MTKAQRILLAAGLGLVGPFTALATGVLLLSLGVRSDPVLTTIALVTASLALIVAAAFTPRAIDGGRYSALRKCVAGGGGVITATLVARALTLLGIDGEALSHEPSAWALVQEGIMMASFYGTMLLTAYLVLGRPMGEAARPPNDEMQLTAPTHAMERRS